MPAAGAARPFSGTAWPKNLTGSGWPITWNDQAETVFFRLLRGHGGARGLRGILPVQGRKLRPFLALEKETLRARRQRSGACAGARTRATRIPTPTSATGSAASFRSSRRAGRASSGGSPELAAEAQGWKFLPEPEPDFFVAGAGIRFARFPALPSPGALARGLPAGASTCAGSAQPAVACGGNLRG